MCMLKRSSSCQVILNPGTLKENLFYNLLRALKIPDTYANISGFLAKHSTRGGRQLLA